MPEPFETWAEAPPSAVPRDDGDRSDVDRDDLQAVFPKFPAMTKPLVHAIDVNRVGGVADHTRAAHAIERFTVQMGIAETLLAGQRVTSMPVHDCRAGVSTTGSVRRALLWRVRHMRVLVPRGGLVEADLDDDRGVLHPQVVPSWRARARRLLTSSPVATLRAYSSSQAWKLSAPSRSAIDRGMAGNS